MPTKKDIEAQLRVAHEAIAGLQAEIADLNEGLRLACIILNMCFGGETALAIADWNRWQRRRAKKSEGSCDA